MPNRPSLLMDRPQRSGISVPQARPAPQAPFLRPDPNAAMPFAPQPGAATLGGACAEERVQLAGGLLNSLIVHPTVVPFEQLYRRLPEEGMFSAAVSPTNPFTFELGAFRVPQNFALLLFDLRPDIYRFSGVDPGDFMPIEARRFSSIMGFQVTVDQRTPANLYYEIDPIAIQRAAQQAFTNPNVPSGGSTSFDTTMFTSTPQSTFNINAANSFANAAGAGTGLLPQRPTRYGPTSVPFTLIARSGSTVQIRCVIFRPVPSPIAFVEYDIAGIMMPTQWLDRIEQCAKPVATPAR